jgi:hypothetical protein
MHCSLNKRILLRILLHLRILREKMRTESFFKNYFGVRELKYSKQELHFE